MNRAFNNGFWSQLRSQLQLFYDAGTLTPDEVRFTTGEQAQPEFVEIQTIYEPRRAEVDVRPLDFQELYKHHVCKAVKLHKETLGRLNGIVERMRKVTDQKKDLIGTATAPIVPSIRVGVRNQALVLQMRSHNFHPNRIQAEMDRRIGALEAIVKSQCPEMANKECDMARSLELMGGLIQKYCNTRLLDVHVKAARERRQLYYKRYTNQNASLSEFRDSMRLQTDRLASRFRNSLTTLNSIMPLVTRIAAVDAIELANHQILINRVINMEARLKVAEKRFISCCGLIQTLRKNLLRDEGCQAAVVPNVL